MADDYDDQPVDTSQGGASTPSRGEYGGTGTLLHVDVTPEGKQVTVNADGSVDIFSPSVITHRWDDDDEFGANLAERLGDQALGSLAADLIEGVEGDEQSRTKIIQQYESGLDLLGTALEEVTTQSNTSRSVSRMGHPLLIETMIKYHAALALDTPVPTPDGWTTMGEIKAGDYVLDEFGQPIRVAATSDVMSDKLCFRVSFADGFAIVADAGHLWTVDERSGPRTKDGWAWQKRDLQTSELVPGQHFIWLSKPLELPPRDLLIDPYILGLWLGDGDTASGRISAGFDDCNETIRNIRACGRSASECRGDIAVALRVEGLTSELKELGVLGGKFIPAPYMRASRSQRQALLQGLMDSDGHINKTTRQCAFANVDFELIAQVQELLKTLSIKSSIMCAPAATRTFPSGRAYACQHSYQLRFTADCDFQIFRLPRKRRIHEEWNNKHPRRTKTVKIVDVRQVQSVPVKCLTIHNESHLFLAGLGMVPTHNSAEAEMLPAEGPAKVMTVGQVSTDEEQMAADFQADFNYYLTEIATEYYPDTSKMIMELAYAGNVFKKVFRDPLRQRPVSESISLIDMIVSEQATDLENAIRVTHQIQMSRSQLRRMQIMGAYRDVDLGWSQGQIPPGRAALQRAEGVSPSSSTRPQDQSYILWETDQDVDLGEFPIAGKWERKAPDGLPLPYKITVDKNTREILGVWRNWDNGDPLYKKDSMYVHYGLMPANGLRFHHWGFLNTLGNQTKVQRAIWRLLIDAGMFSVFPGGVKLRGGRLGTNEINPGPGEWVDVDFPAGVTDIRQLLMAMPYKQLDAVYVQFAQMIDSSAKELAGAMTIETGEGRTNIPVGTMMSMVEQQTQIMAGVHRRVHRAQKAELLKIRKLFARNPQDLKLLARDQSRQWAVEQEFMSLNLVPASDPNIPSQVHHIQLAVALATIAGMAPQMFDMREVLTRLMRTIRIPDPSALLITPEQQQAMEAAGAAGPPQDPSKMAGLQLRKQIAEQSNAQKNQAMQVDMQQQGQDRSAQAAEASLESRDRQLDRESAERIANLSAETERLRLSAELNRDAAKLQHEKEQAVGDRVMQQQEAQHEQGLAAQQAQHEQGMAVHEQGMAQQESEHQRSMAEQAGEREDRHHQEQMANQQAQQQAKPQQKPTTEPNKFGPGTF